MGLYETLYGVPKPRKRSNLENMYMDSERQRAQASAPGLHGITAPNNAQSSGLDTVNAYKARGGIGKNESTLDDDYAKWQQAAADKQLNGTDKYKDYYNSISSAYTDSQKEKSNLEKLYDSTNSNLQNAYNTNKNSLDNQRRSQQQGVHNMTALQRLYEGQRLEKLGIANGSAQTSSDIRMRNSMLSNLGGINQAYGNRLDSYNTAHSNSMNDLNTQYNASLDGIQKKSSSLRDKYMEAYKTNRTNDTYADYAGKVNSVTDYDGTLKEITEHDYLTPEQRMALEKAISGTRSNRIYNELVDGLRNDNADIGAIRTKYSLNKQYLSAEQQNAYTEAFNVADNNKKAKDFANTIDGEIKEMQKTAPGEAIKYDKFLEIQKRIEDDTTMSAQGKAVLQEKLNAKGYTWEDKATYDAREKTKAIEALKTPENLAKKENYSLRGALDNVADTISTSGGVNTGIGGGFVSNSTSYKLKIAGENYYLDTSPFSGLKDYTSKLSSEEVDGKLEGDVITSKETKYVLYKGKWRKAKQI